MSDDVYAKLSKVDVGMAKAYKKALGTKPDDPIDVVGAKAIFREVIDGLKPKGKAAITTAEATALLYLLGAANFTQAAVDYIAQSLVAKTKSKDMVIYEALLEGGAAQQLQGKQLTGITDLLDASMIANLTFHSPDTSIPYLPIHYSSILNLVTTGEIEVFAMSDGGLTSGFLDIGGSYRSDKDRLFLFQQSNLVVLKVLLAHELTHAIQDWMDIPIPSTMAIEADAYIAGAVILKSLKMKPTSGGTYEVAHKKAAPIVLEGKATLDNKAWVDAYREVSDAVGKDTGYGNYTAHADKAGRVEKDKFNETVDKIKKAANAPKKP